MKLKRVAAKQGAGKAKKGEAFISRYAGGLCFDFSHKDPNMYVFFIWIIIFTLISSDKLNSYTWFSFEVFSPYCSIKELLKGISSTGYGICNHVCMIPKPFFKKGGQCPPDCLPFEIVNHSRYVRGRSFNKTNFNSLYFKSLLKRNTFKTRKHVMIQLTLYFLKGTFSYL